MSLHLADVASDMSVFHRIDDVRRMSAQDFIDRAIRLSAYRGVIRARVEEIQHHQRQADAPNSAQPSPTSAPTGRGRDGQARTVSSTAANLATDPGFGGMIETRRASDGG